MLRKTLYLLWHFIAFTAIAFTFTSCAQSESTVETDMLDQDILVSNEPTPDPTATPTPEPTEAPTATPTAAPTATPTPAPTDTPAPTATPTSAPTATPTAEPTPKITPKPTACTMEDITVQFVASCMTDKRRQEPGDFFSSIIDKNPIVEIRKLKISSVFEKFPTLFFAFRIEAFLPTIGNLPMKHLGFKALKNFQVKQGAIKYKVQIQEEELNDDPSKYVLVLFACDDKNNDGRCNDGRVNHIQFESPLSRSLAFLKNPFIRPEIKFRIHYSLDTKVYDRSACEGKVDPLIMDLRGDGIKVTSPDKGVLFDMTNDGTPDRTAWVAGDDDAFLVYDRNNNGMIDAVNELFGNMTYLPEGYALNGFKTLAALDSNGDGLISAADRDFRDLSAWFDQNHDGISQANELVRLPRLKIKKIDLNYYEREEIDAFGNRTNERSLVYLEIAGKEIARVIADVWLALKR